MNVLINRMRAFLRSGAGRAVLEYAVFLAFIILFYVASKALTAS